jgi:ribosomal protein S18 acetylase RimI-like enzyme
VAGRTFTPGKLARAVQACDPWSIAIRPATPADADEIVEVVERAYHPYVERIGRRPAPMDTDAEPLIRTEEVFVLADGAELVGLIVLRSASDHLLVENVAIEPARQRNGHGRALLEFAEAHGRDLGFEEIRLYTNAAMTENLGLYAHLGWLEYDRRVEDGFSRVYFRKPLALL